ncbi:MAG: MFS transporter [Pseudomonadota bacterium]
MWKVLAATWALLFGLLLLMLGNGIQGTLLGIRGDLEGFSTFEMSLVMSAYFVGFLGGSRMTPELIRRVGHVRVFAALGSFISAVLILFPLITEPWAWMAFRVVIGFCFSGVYVTVEGWLNNTVDNENRGKALSLYLIVQMAGIIAAQGFIAWGDPSGYAMFIIPSVLVSIAFAPILLSVTPTPPFEMTQPMSPWEAFQISPLGCVGMFALGGMFSALFGMTAVYGTQVGLSVGQISLFIAMIYVGGLLMQYPIGWLSDRTDRRVLILAVNAAGGVAAAIAAIFGGNFVVILAASFVIGGTANPLYALLLAYVNDFLDNEKMAGASGALVFVNGIGAVAGPVVTGWMMSAVGPWGFWLYLSILMLGLAAYAVWRMTRRPSTVAIEETGPYAPITQVGSVAYTPLAQDYYSGTDDAGEAETATNEISREPLG